MEGSQHKLFSVLTSEFWERRNIERRQRKKDREHAGRVAWLKTLQHAEHVSMSDYAESTPCPTGKASTPLYQQASIKQEPVDYHRYNSDIHCHTTFSVPQYGPHSTVDGSVGQLGQTLARSAPAPVTGGELTEKSRHVQHVKRRGLSQGVFETTGMLVGPTECLRVTHMMIDDSAHSTIVSLKAVKDAGLKIVSCKPKTVPLATGTLTTYYELVSFKLYMCGIRASIRAYIDHGYSQHHVLLGKPALQAFNAKGNFSYGPKNETRWSVARDVKRKRKRRILLQKDRANVTPTLTRYSHEEGLELAEQLGETAEERKSREILERHEERGAKLFEKHGRNVRQTSYDNYSLGFFGRQ